MTGTTAFRLVYPDEKADELREQKEESDESNWEDFVLAAADAYHDNQVELEEIARNTVTSGAKIRLSQPSLEGRTVSIRRHPDGLLLIPQED